MMFLSSLFRRRSKQFRKFLASLPLITYMVGSLALCTAALLYFTGASITFVYWAAMLSLIVNIIFLLAFIVL